ncbi:hypothetical protein ACFX5F_13040 [Flavobacterium sp. ZS1P70]|uniref:DUF3375 domain-containing protein n=1 Tax=Flavobacterium zhoui TaxID=3230414 RepID=A0ABW6I7A7_9FLAO
MEEGLLVFRLHEKIKNGEIDVNFSTQDIQRVIEETNQFNLTSSIPNRERLLKNLLTYFIERPAEQKNLYTLTEYARKFILLLEHKINNPFRKFPLRESFKRYANFSAQDVRQINQFESWFNQGFQATTRENIFDHLEELKSDVQSSIQRLNKLLYSGKETALGLVSEFSVIFSDLGEKADEIRDTLRLGNTLQLEFDLVVSFFYTQSIEFKRPSTPEETSQLNELLYSYTRSSEIKQEINSFFELVDTKLGQLRERIQYASTKLNELQELFRYQSHFKLNLKRLLEYALTAVDQDKCEFVLPSLLLLKGFPEERFKLTAMPDLERDFTQRNMVIDNPQDIEYHRQELVKIEVDLNNQQRTSVLVDHYKERLKNGETIDFTTEFYHLLDNESDEEVAIQVAYELIQYTDQNPGFGVDILPKILKRYQAKPIITWTINLKNQK